jgi:hypothetical protein
VAASATTIPPTVTTITSTVAAITAITAAQVEADPLISINIDMTFFDRRRHTPPIPSQKANAEDYDQGEERFQMLDHSLVRLLSRSHSNCFPGGNTPPNDTGDVGKQGLDLAVRRVAYI